MSVRLRSFAIAVALVCGACGSAASGSRGRSSPVANAQVTHEYPSPPALPEHPSGGSRSPGGAVAQFASSYINWTADTVSADMLALAAHSIGQARSAVQLAAAETVGDYELQRGGIANSGVVEAVAPVRGRTDQYVVVTRELTTATATTAYQGLRPAWHVAIAAVTEIAPGQWAVSGWQPQS